MNGSAGNSPVNRLCMMRKSVIFCQALIEAGNWPQMAMLSLTSKLVISTHAPISVGIDPLRPALGSSLQAQRNGVC